MSRAWSDFHTDIIAWESLVLSSLSITADLTNVHRNTALRKKSRQLSMPPFIKLNLHERQLLPTERGPCQQTHRAGSHGGSLCRKGRKWEHTPRSEKDAARKKGALVGLSRKRSEQLKPRYSS